jgi:hypothetical protein
MSAVKKTAFSVAAVSVVRPQCFGFTIRFAPLSDNHRSERNVTE